MRRLAQRVLTGLVLMLLAGPLLPAAFAEIAPAGVPTPSKPWLEWVVSILILGGCVIVLFKTAKRSHQS